ncbi:hypothetical protein O181_008744 [Austropuccinia psidii MF-1]|uniref:Uncharacterized protein n=1 Tax=Austropuccinia psidii MF-1 TaxID=1389203 RepID=A0A9Q3GJ57_9BASI|nr:hypothetical protein [Austropuccinia psidii MF-1]
MSPVHLRNLGIPRNQPEDTEGLFRTRRPGREHLGHSGGWQDIEGNHTHSAIHFPIQQNLTPEHWKDMDQVLQPTNSSKTFFNGAWTTGGSA